MTRFLPLLVLAAALAACDIDFTEVAVPPDVPHLDPPPEARLNVDLMIDDRPLPELRLMANLWPGTMEDGSTRGLSNDTLYVGVQALAPQETSERGARAYGWASGPEAEHGSLVITAPVVEGLDALPSVLPRTYHRVGADTIRADPGDTLRFETALDNEAADAASSTYWRLSLSSPGFSLDRSDTTAVPAVLTVPAGWTAWAGTSPVHVRLSVWQEWRRELPDGAYVARIALSRDVTWTVVWPETTE